MEQPQTVYKMAEQVRVAVRVRPFNAREISRKAKVIIKMTGNTTEIRDPDNPKAEPKTFSFDYSYWSNDGFKEKPDGYLEPSGSQYADQQKVFDDLGRGVLDNAWNGYNCSLFAYGQTGSGKSYSMVGYGSNKGIVPMSCDALFKEIEARKSKAKKGEEYQVTFSMLEIYNEQVRDLLNAGSMKVKGGLKVRQRPNKGFYVEELKSVPVHSYKEIDQRIEEGTKNRTVASTSMNATSSRAHTIVAINFVQKSPNAAGESMTKSSVINLVDLAGSERADSTGATGDRLKEGANINRSLSTLGNCIKALAEKCGGKKNIIVPFRDSVLTKLLMNALGGNSKTIMIAALSPADINYDETLSTLRFAARAKSVRTQATVNESLTDRIMRELREENEKLKEMLAKGGSIPGAEGGGEGGEDSDELKKQLEEQMKSNQGEIEAMQKSWEEKLAETQREYEAKLEADKKLKAQEKTVPHLFNLNEDPALTGRIVHLCASGKVKVGGGKADAAPEIVLSGLGIQKDHAVIQNDKNKKATLIPNKGAKVLLNGNEITSKKELHHNDRILFGNSNLYVFYHPAELDDLKKKKKPVNAPSYEDAQEEIAKNSGLNKLSKGGKSKEDLLLHEDLVQIWPMIAEANAMSEEMDKKCKFEIALISPQARGQKHGRTEVCVKVKNLQSKAEFMWDRDTFINRKYLMQEMYQNFAEGEDVKKIPKEQDPFYENPAAEVPIGCVHVYMQSLAYMIELKENLTVTDYRGNEQGHLSVEMLPCTKDGKDVGDDFVDDPAELVGRDFFFKLRVQHARGIPKKFKKSFCRFKFYLDDKAVTTPEGSGINPNFNFEHKFDYKPATKQFVEFLQNESLVIEVFGRQDDSSPRTSDLSTEELMLKDKHKTYQKKASGVSDIDPNDDKYKLTAELQTYRRRTERAETKLRKLRELVDFAKKSKKELVKVDDLDKALRGGLRLKAVANIIALSQSHQVAHGARQEQLGGATSQACSIQ